MIINANNIIESASLVDIISKVAGVSFSRSGANYVCLSPFNEEQTPSCVISERKGIYKDFSSGNGGNIISFLMDYRNYGFVEAIEELAGLTNHIVDYGTGNREQMITDAKIQKDTKTNLIHATRKAHDFYSLHSTTENDDYVMIAGKSYSLSILKRWNVVFAGDFNRLSDTCATWVERTSIIDAGLIKLNKSNTGFYDFFHHRVLFPLYNLYGEIVGYNGRIDPDYFDGHKYPEKTPKYLNSPDTLIYKKGEHLFGYHQNQRKINELNIANLVEGPTDVIMMDQFHLSNAVCSSGTAFTLDQAKIIARDADLVIIMFDGDEAGIKATRKAIEICIIAQLDVKVRLLPDKEDPASFLILEYNTFMHSQQIIDEDTGELMSLLNPKLSINHDNGLIYAKDRLLSISEIDGIQYYIDTEYPHIARAELSPSQHTGELLAAARLISYIKDEHTRDQYAVTIGKYIGTTTTELKSTIREQIDARLDAKNKLTPEQELQKNTYGLYIDHNKYYDYNGNEISNFVIRPLFLVSYSEKAKRVFEITNKVGHSKIINMESDEFITLMGFRRQTERLGAFIFKGTEIHYTKIREWVYNDMQEVYPIEMLGYQKNTGIYAWSNGIMTPGSHQLMEVDEYGVVEHESIKYFLPTYSKINIRVNPDPMENEFEKSFRWIAAPSGTKCPKSLTEWCHTFAKVFDDNASIALCYLFAAVHRDFLHARYDMFPHLNLFGPAGSGKTFMAQIITAAFGKPMRATHLVSSSEVAFYRRIAQSCNAIVWYEEYSEKVNPQKQEALKNFADGFGRITGKMTNDNQTKATPVHNACIISGQILPSHDPALLERCITLYFEKFVGDKHKQQIGELFKSWSKSGYFAYVAAEIHSYRTLIEDSFDDTMEVVRDHLRSQFSAATQPGDRVLNNFSMIATIYTILATKLKLPFKIAEVYDMIVDRIREQTKAVEGAEELSGFWSTLEFLIDLGRSKETANKGITSDHYAVELVRELTVKINEKETKTVKYTEDTKVIFLRMNYAHKMYSITGKSQGLSRILEIGTLKHYLQIHKSFIGEIKAKKLNGSPQRVWAFDLTYMPNLEFELTNFHLQDEKPKAADNYNPAEGIKPQKYDQNGQELPF